MWKHTHFDLQLDFEHENQRDGSCHFLTLVLSLCLQDWLGKCLVLAGWNKLFFLDTKIDASIFQIPICGLSSYNLPESFLSDTASWWRMLRGWSDLPPIGRRFQNSLHSEPRMCCVLQCLFMSCCKQSISVRLSLQKPLLLEFCTKGVSLWWFLPWTCFTAHRVSTWCGWVTIASKVPTWLIHLPNGY